MKMNPWTLLAMLILVFVALAVPLGAQTIFYVDSATGSDTHIGTSWGTAFRNVTKAVAAADTSAAPEVDIWIAKGTYWPTDGVSSLPADHRDTSFAFYRGNGIGKALKIYGGFAGTETSITMRDTANHTYLDGQLGTDTASFHVVVVAGLPAAADSLVLDGLTIRHGVAGASGVRVYNSVPVYQYGGGGIALYSDSSLKFVIRNCVVQNNYSGTGGGMYCSSALYTMINCTMTGNSCTSGTVAGGAMYNVNATPMLRSCSFTSNHCSSSNNSAGGVMSNQSSMLQIVNCIFQNNYCDVQGGYTTDGAYGGAVYSNNSTLTIDSCTFTANRVAGGTLGGGALCFGGALYNTTGNTVIRNSSFSLNVSSSVEREGPLRGGKGYGGAIYNYGSPGLISSCNFYRNRAIGYAYSDAPGESGWGYGGAIANFYYAPDVANCTFTADTAFGAWAGGYSVGGGCGGGIYDSFSSPHISHCNFYSEVAYGTNEAYGGAICSNTSAVLNLDSCHFDSAYSLTRGGAVYLYNGIFNIARCVYNGNSSGSGGAMNIGGPGVLITSSTNASDNVFIGNRATGGGGAVYVYPNSGTDTVLNNLFIDNKDASAYGGGGIVCYGSNHFLANNTFYADSTTAGRGGAILVAGANCTIANNVFYQDYGAGPGIDTGLSSPGAITFANNSLSSIDPVFVNEADPQGADMLWGTADDGLILTHCSPAIDAGSEIYVLPGELTDFRGIARVAGIHLDAGAYQTSSLSAINGIRDICVGSTVVLSDTTASGSWFSTNTSVAMVGSTGLVTALSAGADTILYVLAGACSADTALFPIHVIAASNAGAVDGTISLCSGAATILTDSVTDGVWSASNGNATIDSAGQVHAVTAGVDTVTYTNSCASGLATAILTINPLPFVGAIYGDTILCTGLVYTLSDTTTGGTWSSYSANLWHSGSMVEGTVPGPASIAYIKTNGWGCTDSAVLYLDVLATPHPGVIYGETPACVGTTHMWSDGDPGGVWSTSNDSVAQVASGAVVSLAAGTDTVKYTKTNACGSVTDTMVVTVQRYASIVTGTDTFCVGVHVLLKDSAAGGVWSSVDPAAATVNAAGLVIGIQEGPVGIDYTLTNVCGISYGSIIVDIQQPAMPIVGADFMCIGESLLFSDSTYEGIWTSTDSSVAAIDSFIGFVFAVAPGTATISYSVSNTCGMTYATENIEVYTAAQCDSATSVDQPALKNGLEIFPNPATSVISISAPETIHQVVITDISGKEMFTGSYGSSKVEIDVTQLPPSLYFVKVDHYVVRKFVKN